MAPDEEMTRCQGTEGSWRNFSAEPTSRECAGWPVSLAMWPYEVTRPYGMSRVMSYTLAVQQHGKKRESRRQSGVVPSAWFVGRWVAYRGRLQG